MCGPLLWWRPSSTDWGVGMPWMLGSWRVDRGRSLGSVSSFKSQLCWVRPFTLRAPVGVFEDRRRACSQTCPECGLCWLLGTRTTSQEGPRNTSLLCSGPPQTQCMMHPHCPKDHRQILRTEGAICRFRIIATSLPVHVIFHLKSPTSYPI